jgi:hypothetical protein
MVSTTAPYLTKSHAQKSHARAFFDGVTGEDSFIVINRYLVHRIFVE